MQEYTLIHLLQQRFQVQGNWAKFFIFTNFKKEGWCVWCFCFHLCELISTKFKCRCVVLFCSSGYIIDLVSYNYGDNLPMRSREKQRKYLTESTNSNVTQDIYFWYLLRCKINVPLTSSDPDNKFWWWFMKLLTWCT